MSRCNIVRDNGERAGSMAVIACPFDPACKPRQCRGQMIPEQPAADDLPAEVRRQLGARSMLTGAEAVEYARTGTLPTRRPPASR